MAVFLDSPVAVTKQSTPSLLHRYSSTFATFQSECFVEESDSDESENNSDDFSITKSITSAWANIRRKSLQTNSSKSKFTTSDFQNFKIRSLTIVSMESESDITHDTDHDLLELDQIFEDEKRGTDDESDDDIAPVPDTGTPAFGDKMIDLMMDDVRFIKKQGIQLTNIDDDDKIIAQLEVFGYNRSSIIKAMESVTDSTDINAIKEKLDTVKKAVIHKQHRASKIERRNRKRRFIEAEIIATEKSYVDGLHTLLNELIQPIFYNNYVEAKYYDRIRSSLPKMEQYHRQFLNKLNDAFLNKDSDKHKMQSLPSIFNRWFTENKEHFVDIYSEFIKDYEGILDLFGTTFHGNIELDEFLKQKRKERKPLASYLILPVQRVPRYILLLTDLRKNTEESSEDYKDITEATEMIKDITVNINEKKRAIENLSTCLHIQEELNGLKEPIVDDHRYFIDEFIFIKKDVKHQRLFFLFNDIMIVANSKWKVKHIMDVMGLDVKMDKTKKELPEFELVSGAGRSVYIGQNMKTVTKFQKLIGKNRVKMMTGRLTQRCDTLGSLKDLLAREAQQWDDMENNV